MKNIVLVGPWGSSGTGESWSFKANGKIVKIYINHGDCVDAIGFTSEDEDGNLLRSPMFGGSGGGPSEVEIDIEVDELNYISGTFGFFESKLVVTSLTFATSTKKFGPYGIENGTHFSVPVSKGNFAGFFGRHKDYLHAIGVYLMPT